MIGYILPTATDREHRVLFMLLLLLSLASSCSRKSTPSTTTQSISVETIQAATDLTTRSASTGEDIQKKIPCNCLSNEHYMPRQELAVAQDVKTIRTAFFFPNSSDKANNWTGEDAVKYARTLNYQGNIKLEMNKPMRLPEGNSTPVYPIPWRYTMHKDAATPSGNAVYEVIDDELYYFVNKGKNRNDFNTRVIKKYGAHTGVALNVFAMSHHPDSIASPTYKPSRAGIAFSNSLKIGGVRQHTINENWKMASCYNHEVGHVLGLQHSWYKNDRCDDTPPHSNCYSAKPDGPCKGPVSNNMMDYNNSQIALTPCQIAIATKYMHNAKSKVRPLLVKDWCTFDGTKTLVVTDSLHIDRHLDLKGDLIVKEGAWLRISCRLHVPAGGKIIVEPNATLELNGCQIHNDCDDTWQGIELLSRGTDTATLVETGTVILENLPQD